MAGSHGANLQHQPMARQRPCEWCHSLRWQRFCPRHTTHSTMGTLCSDKHQLKMWHDTPSDIQEEILQRLPVKSLIRFRCVSKQWKSLIDSSKFIQDHSSYQHHLLARYKLESESGLECECFSIINNDNIDVFANEKSSLTLPLFLSSCEYIYMYNSVNGFLCFQGYNSLDTLFAVFWNPTVGKSVSFKFPNGFWSYNSIGFGVCPDTFYPKLVSIKINDSTSRWEVGIFTLSSHAWKEVYKLYRPIRKCYLTRDHVCIKRRIYWLGFYFNSRGGGSDTNVIVSFDLISEKFGKVRLPDRLLFTRELRVTEVNGSLGVIEYIDDVGYGVWMMEFFTKLFTKMFTVKIPNELRYYDKVFEFRRNGDNKSKLEA